MPASWTALRPALASKASREAFLSFARALVRARVDEGNDDALGRLRADFTDRVLSSTRSDRQALLASGLLLADLAVQGWRLRVRDGCVGMCPPVELAGDQIAEKARIRRQELVKRDAQLRQPPVQAFVRSMERSRVFNGRFVSIFSLMRDGRELADRLRTQDGDAAPDPFVRVVDPFLEFVESEATTCSLTGLRLMDIWRYFRHTWTNQYTSVPGRSMMFLVRDRAAPMHPVMGIAALSSPVMQIRERDAWIGWNPDVFLKHVHDQPTGELAEWLWRTVQEAINEIYVEDLLEDKVLSPKDINAPTPLVLSWLIEEGAEQRRLHHRYVRSGDHKVPKPRVAPADYWVGRARTHLFRSKRALALASYLRSRLALKQAFGGTPNADKLKRLAETTAGADAIRTIIRKAKADRIGIAVADLTVCGAVQPYNAILGGKLVAMLATSPEVVAEYHKRYADAESEIASSMAGRPIVRRPTLAVIGTTSLYGIGSSQYNRITIPCDRVGGAHGAVVHYKALGHSEAFGTSQYSDETVDALTDLVQQSTNGQRVNSIFGEGISPKLRKIREGISMAGLPADLLLRHHRRRVVYAVSLVSNLREHLLGMEPEPHYLFPLTDGPTASARIAGWWRERWLRHRVASDAVLQEVGRHTLVRPIRHGGRVIMASDTEQPELFSDNS